MELIFEKGLKRGRSIVAYSRVEAHRASCQAKTLQNLVWSQFGGCGEIEESGTAPFDE